MRGRNRGFKGGRGRGLGRGNSNGSTLNAKASGGNWANVFNPEIFQAMKMQRNLNLNLGDDNHNIHRQHRRDTQSMYGILLCQSC